MQSYHREEKKKIIELHITLIGPHNVLSLIILTDLFCCIFSSCRFLKSAFKHPSCPALPFKKQLQGRKVFFPAPSDVIPTLKILTQDCVTQLDDSSVLHESVVAFHHPCLLLFIIQLQWSCCCFRGDTGYLSDLLGAKKKKGYLPILRNHDDSTRVSLQWAYQAFP